MTRTSADPAPILVAGRWERSPRVLDVLDPAHPGQLAGRTYQATPEQLEAATVAAEAALPIMRALPAYERGRILRETARLVLERRDELARSITLEAGKPIRDATTEVERTALAFRIGAEEAERITGETIPLDLNAASRGRWGITRRFPIGPVAAISPFNLPLGLAVHKLAPAIAAGCPIVLKPPSKAPLALLALAGILVEAGVPEGALSVLPMDRELGDRMVGDDRFRLLTFTGSPAVGWAMKARAGRKKVVLELGGNAAVIVDSTADIDRAVLRCLQGGYKYAGQLCISVQRMYVHASVWDTFMERFVAGAQELVTGDPMDPATDLGPMVDPAAVSRTQRWVDEAVAAGGQLVFGGRGEGAWFPPSLLTDVPKEQAICTEEAFAPIVVAAPFEDFDAVLAEVNDSRFGLQAGLFTNDLAHAWKAFEELQVGGVIVNDVPTYRIDHMPYGGVKDSGLGREGLRWAIEDMTEVRILVLA
ncbi:MAG: aldehyde dehydrogenase family protein [Chloroflexi bacterium]|nr:aldehyde dehydrogenase family protein [Chloroflexota bacterium]